MAVFAVSVSMVVTVDTDEISLVGEDRNNTDSQEVTVKILDDIKSEIRDAAEKIPYLYPQHIHAIRKAGSGR